MTVRFVGCGDAFGSGGRFHTCIDVQAAEARFLLDCGASSLIAMKRFGVDPAAIDAILLTHLHGDHFGGLPFFLLDAQFVARRTRPLVVAGPPGLAERTRAAMEVFFPGSTGIELRFPLDWVELPERTETSIAGFAVTPYPVVHPSGAPAYALRVAVGGKTIAYSGDTEWTDALVDAAQGADLFVCEAYTYEQQVPNHLPYRTLLNQRDRLGCRRLVVTHLSDDLLGRLPELELEAAEDGKVVVV
ncbi:MAG: MBL fold metallo-hydrolase [Chloroflexota bacterium]|nr:MBL fold metallo-hydrolase [Chloroflexota bacterium]